jgi:hypothetical protein
MSGEENRGRGAQSLDWQRHVRVTQVASPCSALGYDT